MGLFDENHKKIICAFMALKNKAIFLERGTLLGNYNLNRNNLPFIRVYNYYTSLKAVCDLPIVFMINEELSNLAARQHCPDLLIEMYDEKHLTPVVHVNGKVARLSNDDFLNSMSDIRGLLSNRINEMVGSLMLDFTVSAFSCFENWVSKLYSGYAEKLEADYEKSRREKVLDLLGQYGEAESDDARLKCLEDLLSIRGAYRSFPDKINALYKMVEKENYARDVKKDKKIIEFLGACRNTVHNSGFHRGKPRQVECNGITYVLETNRPWYNKSYLQSIAIIGELVDIYSALVKSLSELPVHEIYEEVQDEASMLKLECVVDIALRSDMDAALEDYLVNELGVGRLQAANIAKLVAKIRLEGSRDPDEVYAYEFLVSDLLQPLAPEEKSETLH